ncbi:hypothetical protein PHMEG_0009959 [Phytophthora megakarya]|uniref:Uncharacterized protein n=1 Tax=Phytophthora megakarya TaxID=4795 RepID=A0A225WFU7_9STRA|nr:hypothetical protein PHMEG_0009959 [Phytophthora megakarya]
MPSRLPWNNIPIALPRGDANILLETFKAYKTDKSDRYWCTVWTMPTPHLMRCQLLSCACPSCASLSPCFKCPWRGHVRGCVLLQVVNLDELYAHTSLLCSPPAKPKLTLAIKGIAHDWASQGLKLLRIYNGLMQRFNVGEDSMPALAVVQRFVHNHVSVRLGGTDLFGVVRLKIQGSGYTGHEFETSAFRFAWRWNQDGTPEVEKQEQNTELLSLLRRWYQVVTGKKLQARYAMADAELDLWNDLQHVFGDCQGFRFLTCYHSPSGFATTTNPCKTLNAAFKRDVILRWKLKVGALIDELQTLCISESVRARTFAKSANLSDQWCRIALLDRRSKEDLPASAQLNCRFYMKHGSCIHLLLFLDAVGSLDVTGRETYFYLGMNQRKLAEPGQTAGRSRINLGALEIK